jgi:2-iminoacetate synthase
MVADLARMREAPDLRDGLHRIGITHTSAGSHTEPGGYEEPGGAEEQFEVADHRSPAQVAASLRSMGYDPVWEDPSLVTGVARGLLPARP